MLIFKDLITGEELCSDSYPHEVLFGGTVLEVKTEMVTSGGESFDIGANPSAEGGEEGVDDTKEQVNNLVSTHQLQETGFSKKQYIVYIKKYMKNLVTKLKEVGKPDEEVKAFQKGIEPFVKKVLSTFDEYRFYVGPSMDTDGMVALNFWKEDGTPFFYFIKTGLLEEKF